MSIKVLNTFKFLNRNGCSCSLRCLSRSSNSYQIAAKPVLRQPQDKKKIGPFGWFLLAIPASTFALGTWQIQRKKWKEGLITKLRDLTTADPVPLPENLDELNNMEYRPVCIRGTFLHNKEIHMGPRSLILKGDASSKSQLMTSSSKSNQGYLIITPFKLSGRDETILVNRGWVPIKCKNPNTRQKGQVEGEVDVVGIVRVNENRPQFTPPNQVESNQWFYKDLNQMAAITGALPILLDATNDFDVSEGPIGGQTRVTLRNEHFSYVVTWYSLCAVTSFMWYKQFLQKVK